ncbi:hypothetical protein Tco_0167342, partial [Tanacetum coccineum]
NISRMVEIRMSDDLLGFRCLKELWSFRVLVFEASMLRGCEAAEPVLESIWLGCVIEASHMHKAYKKRIALGFRALSLGAPRKGDGF